MCLLTEIKLVFHYSIKETSLKLSALYHQIMGNHQSKAIILLIYPKHICLKFAIFMGEVCSKSQRTCTYRQYEHRNPHCIVTVSFTPQVIFRQSPYNIYFNVHTVCVYIRVSNRWARMIKFQWGQQNPPGTLCGDRLQQMTTNDMFKQ